MEVGGLFGHGRERVVDLVVERLLREAAVLHRDLEALAERHLPVGVERAARVHAHRERRDLGVAAPARGEEVADRGLHRRRGLAVPVDAEDEIPPGSRRRHPDVLDRAFALDLAHGEGLAGRDLDRRRDLPAPAKITGDVRARPLRGHSALALLAREVLGADGARARLGQARQAAHAEGPEDVVFGPQRRGDRRDRGDHGEGAGEDALHGTSCLLR